MSETEIPSGDVTTHLVYAAPNGGFARQAVTVHDARALIEHPLLEREGFTLVTHQITAVDYFDPDRVRAVCYPAVEEILRKATGAARAVAFEHDVRCAGTAERRARGAKEPVRVVHDDYTAKSTPARARLYLDAEAEELLRGDYGAINLWWPLIGPVRDTPLAVCDARTIEAADLVPTEQGVKHEVYLLNFNPNHRWFYFPAMTTSEMLLFKCFDSRTGSGARMTAHSAFDLPGGGGTPSRQSIEVRALVFFAR